MAENSFITSYVRSVTGDDRLDSIQNGLENSFRSIEACPLLDGKLLEDVVLAIGDNNVPHKLGREVKGWVITRVKGEPAGATAETVTTQAATTAIDHSWENIYNSGVTWYVYASAQEGTASLGIVHDDGTVKLVTSDLIAADDPMVIVYDFPISKAVFCWVPTGTTSSILTSRLTPKPTRYAPLAVYDNLNTSKHRSSVLSLNSNAVSTVDIWVF